MKRYLYFALLLTCVAAVSCSGDDDHQPVNPQPGQSKRLTKISYTLDSREVYYRVYTYDSKGRVSHYKYVDTELKTKVLSDFDITYDKDTICWGPYTKLYLHNSVVDSIAENVHDKNSPGKFKWEVKYRFWYKNGYLAEFEDAGMNPCRYRFVYDENNLLTQAYVENDPRPYKYTYTNIKNKNGFLSWGLIGSYFSEYACYPELFGKSSAYVPMTYQEYFMVSPTGYENEYDGNGNVIRTNNYYFTYE